MNRTKRDEGVNINRGRIFDGEKYIARKLFQTRGSAETYAKKMEEEGHEIQVARTRTAQNLSGFAVYVKK